jgi:hypothetical protein
MSTTYENATLVEAMSPWLSIPGEASAFVVKLVSEELKQYSIHVEAAWYGAADPDKTGTTSSDTLTAEFPERISAGPLMAALAPKTADRVLRRVQPVHGLTEPYAGAQCLARALPHWP